MSDVLGLVSARVEADPGLSDDAKLFILAALEGGESLADMAGYNWPEVRPNPTRHPEPAGAFLKKIDVRAFRGIGPEASLELKPGPGLTVVAGRNGSGKSSFAEALEVALTGTTYRWLNKRSKQWQDAWRNLHVPDNPRIQVTLAEEGVGSTRIGVEWASGAELSDMKTFLQRHGQKREAGVESLGWTAPLETFRPLLSNDELGSILAAEPSKLYDAISNVLGLEQISDAVRRLDTRCKDLAQPEVIVNRSKKSIVAALQELEDERAQKGLALVKARTPDSAELRALATGSSDNTDTVTTSLRDLLQLSLPENETVATTAAALKQCVREVASAGDTTAALLERRVALLEAALAAHDHDGDMTCPVCGTGVLNSARAAVLRREVESADRTLDHLRRARTALRTARNSAQSLLSSPPVILTAHLPEELATLQRVTLDTWAAWATAPDEHLALVEHLLGSHEPVAKALGDLQAAAALALASRDDAWAGAASQLARFADNIDAWQAGIEEHGNAKAALKWLKSNDLALKNERVAPISASAAHIWEGLRQESNVEIAVVGTGSQARTVSSTGMATPVSGTTRAGGSRL